ncbi:MAG: LCP family protein [Spirulina sp. SIO3F2]|nr:LCP family protein [Spirulina sp. SIO3F2]
MPKRSIPAPKYKTRSSAPGQGKKRVPKKKSARWFWVWLGLTGIGLVSAAVGAILAVSLSATPLRNSLPAGDTVFADEEAIAEGRFRFPKLTRPVNILVIGTKVLTADVDSQASKRLGYHGLVDSFDGLADTMLLIRFDPEQFKLSVLSVPRDTRVRLSGYGEMKLNAANYHGGAALTARALSQLLDGIAIDRYVRINVQGVEQMIDALGGVEVYVPKDMKYTDHSQHLYIDLKEGQQRLDGEQAVQFLRFRQDRYGDIGRVQRQQTLMRAVVEQTLRPQTLLKIPKLFQVIQESIDTNLSVEEVAALAGFAANTEREDVQMLMLPGGFNGTGQTGVSYWLPNDSGIQTMLAQHFNYGVQGVRDRDARSLRIAIQDSTGNPAAVDALKQALSTAGYRNVYVGSSWQEPLRETRIVAQKGDRLTASNLKTSLGIGDVRVESTGELNSDLTIQLGQDWQQLR